MTKYSNLALAHAADDDLPLPARPDAGAIIDRVVELRPWLRDMQPEAERQRRIPQETVERLDATGAYSVAMPPRFGGADFSARELFSIYEALGRGCGATAWTLWASTGGNMWSAAFTDAAVRPVYDAPWVGNRTCAVGGSTRRLSGTARRVEGGWMVKGAWPFATGSVHASHAYLAVYFDPTDDSKVGMVLLSRDQYELRDDWDAMGLAATGSGTIVVAEELFVPDERFSTPQLLFERLGQLKERGAGLRPGGLGRSIMVGTGNAIGMAEHALELFRDGIAKKGIAYSPYARQIDAPVTHLNVGQVQMQIKAARAVAESALADLDRLYKDDGEVTPADTVRYHADAAFIWDTCATAIETLFKASGASGIARKSPLQLVARNCRAGSMHAAHNIQTCMENYGRQLCGVDTAVTSTSVLERAGVSGPILVTSANGNQGARLIPKLLTAGHTVRACVRSEASAERLRALGVAEVMVGDLADPAFVGRAVADAGCVYHVGPTLHPAERAMGFAMVDAAAAAGVGHFVFSSVLHAVTTDLIQHEIKRDIEEHLLSSGLEFTILQPANYMLPHRLKPVFEEGVFRLSWSLDRRQSMVDLEDMTDVAARVLGEPGRHAAATYELVGPGRFTAHDIARVLSAVVGREIGVERIDVAAFTRARLGDADPDLLAHHLRLAGAISARYSAHDFLGNPNVLGWLLGRAPTSFEAFARREHAAWAAAREAVTAD